MTGRSFVGPERYEAINRARGHLSSGAALRTQVAAEMADLVADIAFAVIATLRAGRKLLFCGNGGSAADSQHLAAELVGRYLRERRPLPAIALTTDTSALTAIGNDYRFDDIFARQIDALGFAGDLLFALSTSGQSADVVLAAQTARAKGIVVVAFTGQSGGELIKHADYTLAVPSVETPLIQEIHLAVGHIICDLTELALIAAPETFGKGRDV